MQINFGTSPNKTGDSPCTRIHRAVLATDLDGTLAVGGVIHEENRLAAARLRSRGISLLIATGRNLHALGRINQLWDIADVVIFASGAGLLEGPGAAAVERARLQPEELTQITTILNEVGEDYCLLGTVPNNHHFRWRRFRPNNPDFDKRMEIYSQWGRPDGGDNLPASQVLVIRPAGAKRLGELIEALSEWSVFYSSSPIDGESCWLEIFPAGLDKGSALALWAEENSLDAGNFLALGNDLNDSSMLAWAAHGRVVAGAPSELARIYPVLPPADGGGFAAAVDEAIRLFGTL